MKHVPKRFLNGSYSLEFTKFFLTSTPIQPPNIKLCDIVSRVQWVWTIGMVSAAWSIDNVFVINDNILFYLFQHMMLCYVKNMYTEVYICWNKSVQLCCLFHLLQHMLLRYVKNKHKNCAFVETKVQNYVYLFRQLW